MFDKSEEYEGLGNIIGSQEISVVKGISKDFSREEEWI